MATALIKLFVLIICTNVLFLVRCRRHHSCTETIANREHCLTHYFLAEKREHPLNFEMSEKKCNAVHGTLIRPFTFEKLKKYKLFNIVKEPYIWIGAKHEGDGYYRWVADGAYMFENRESQQKNWWHEGTMPELSGEKKCLALVVENGTLKPENCSITIPEFVCEVCVSKSVVNNCRKRHCACESNNQVKCRRMCKLSSTKYHFCFTLRPMKDECEVEKCTTNTFGNKCSFVCNCREESDACNEKDGSCPGGKCKDGWSGKSCNITKCPVGKWGWGCKNNCFCRNNQPCDAQTGYCSNGCPKFVGGPSCTLFSNLTCARNKFDPPKCQRSCHCSNDSTCNDQGICLISEHCKQGYAGPACEFNVCPPGKWGPKCQYYCVCNGGHPCDENGHCSTKCKYKWMQTNACSDTGCMQENACNDTGCMQEKACNDTGCMQEKACNDTGCMQENACNDTGCPVGNWGPYCGKKCTCDVGHFCFEEHSNGNDNGSKVIGSDGNPICEDTFVTYYKNCPESPKRYGPVGYECAFKCNDKCDACDPNSGGTICTKDCPAKRGKFIPVDDECVCADNCEKCGDEGKCLKCNSSFNLVDHACVAGTPAAAESSMGWLFIFGGICLLLLFVIIALLVAKRASESYRTRQQSQDTARSQEFEPNEDSPETETKPTEHDISDDNDAPIEHKTSITSVNDTASRTGTSSINDGALNVEQEKQ